IQEELAQPFFIDGQEVYATASIGIASSASGYAAAEEVLRDADLAMYRAKSQGKARYEIFDQRMRAGAMRRLDLESNLRRALENQEFVLFYQPIVRLETAEIKGFEALVRWRRPDGDMVYPADFVEVAEDTGLIVPLGAWALEEACRTMQGWRVQFPQAKALTISVNLSARQFGDAELAHQVDSVLRRTGLMPQALDLEITESVMMGDSERSVKLLAQLKKLGLRFSIDDFGTGYSSLSYLHRFPLDTLKIDRSFVAQLGEGRDGVAIVRSILDLARNLGMQIIAEGAETEKQVAQLRRLGCEFAQGYYFSEPLEASRATDLLRSSNTALASRLGEAPPEFVV
ncbi:MAG: putative bifunctional diguanylate cyclase/phosphodiesterase, partial [Terriglobales bacterium]